MSSGRSRKWLAFVFLWLVLLGAGAAAYKYLVLDNPDNPFFPRTPSDRTELPFILWGGDVATFYANGGLETKAGTIFDRQGLKLKLVRGDDFDKQVKDYLSNKSPFLRGTMSMLGQVSEEIGKSEKTRPVVFLQLTWSAGDYLVARERLKTLADLKGKTVALQKGGPHVGMLDDILRTAKLHWSDIKVVWTPDVTGDKGPSALFRKENTVDGCFAITPDMLQLTGGPDKVGTGVAGSVENAHVLVSTKNMSRSIADVYACRKDYYDAHKEQIEKLTAGYLKACEELEDLKKGYDAKAPGPTARYKDLLRVTQEIYGKDDVPDEEAADGLVGDAVFVHLPGNVSFFTETGNLSGFVPKMTAALDLAIALGDARGRYEFLKADLDYSRIKMLGGLTRDLNESRRTIIKNYVPPDPGTQKKNTIFAFEIQFGANQSEFPTDRYGEQFQRVAQQGSLFGKSVILVRGHTDLFEVLATFVKEGLAKNVIKREGEKGNYRYYLGDGTPFALGDTGKILGLIEKHDLADAKAVVTRCDELSLQRAQSARAALIRNAEEKGYQLDQNQIVATGVGVREPAIAVPRTDADLEKNRRVEFRIIRVTTEALTVGGGDF